MAVVFKVWDELNGDEAHAKEITFPTEHGYDPYGAALLYGQRDLRGQDDGLYAEENGNALQSLDAGQPVSVRGPDGVLFRYLVGITEYRPVWGAKLVAEQRIEVRIPAEPDHDDD